MLDLEPTDEQSRKNLIARQRQALLTGELVPAGVGAETPGSLPSDDEINRKYERGEIRIVTEQARYPLDSITKLLGGNNYKLDPDYQRRRRWTEAQKSRLIESFIMNVPVPPVFIYEWDYNKYEVMDGLQRMTAVRDFYDGLFTLTGLEYWQELEGRRYNELPVQIRAGIDRRYISSIILLKETSHGDEDPERLKRFVFGRINTGGVKLSAQELRNALYDGPMNQLCKELSANAHLREMWGIPQNVEELIEGRESSTSEGEMLDFDVDVEPKDIGIPESYRNMGDVELVLRFFANRQRMIHYRDNIRGYLDAYLQEGNRYSPDTINELREIFQSTLSLAHGLFGEFAFRRRRNGKWGNVPSQSIFDALNNVLARLIENKDDLLRHKDEIVDGLDDFYNKNSKKFNLRGQTRADVMDREILLEDFLRGFLQD